MLMLMRMSGEDYDPWPSGHVAVAAIGTVEARLLWSLRRLALMSPVGSARCPTVHAALQRDFGDAGLGIEHLLRCCLVGLSRLATRRLAIGAPACRLVTADEAALLRIMRSVDGEDAHLHDAEARDALAALAGNGAAQALLPLFAALGGLVRPFAVPGD